MNRNVIVTGGAQGIGKIIAVELLKRDFSVSVFDHDVEAIEEFLAEEKSNQLTCFETDVAQEEHVQKSVKNSFEKYGNISAVINNAGISINKPMTDLSLTEWNRVIGTNLTGAFLCAKYTSVYLHQNRGSIINISSTRALQSEANTEAYSASKGGILALTHSLAVSLGPQVRVNCISPGWIDVSAVRKKSEASQTDLSDDDHRQHPAGRVGKAEDIASMILFLLDPANDFITGQNFVIDGGMSRKMIYV